MRHTPITITESDATRLHALLRSRAAVMEDQDYVHEVAAELERAIVVAQDEIEPDIVTMNSRVRVLDMKSGVRHEWTLVFPHQADVRRQHISVLAPLGTALLGFRTGDELEWKVPGGSRSLRIEKVRQPDGERTDAQRSDTQRADTHRAPFDKPLRFGIATAQQAL